MKRSSLAEIADRMKGIDIAILSTHTDGGEIANRPMSNNGDVAYNGDSYFFTHENARCVTDIQRDRKLGVVRLARLVFGLDRLVCLSRGWQGRDSVLRMPS